MEWSAPYPNFVYALVAIALAATLIVARRFAVSPQLRNWLLFAPRVLLLGGLLIVAMNPVRLHESQLPPRRSNVAYLIDASRSMALDAPARLDIVKQSIYEATQQIDEQDRPRLHVYRFGERLSAAPSIPQLQADHELSRLGGALSDLPSRFGQVPPQALVVFSDGQWSGAANLEEIAERYKRLNVALHAFPVGDQSVRGDVSIEDLVAPRLVAPGAKTPVRVAVRGAGYDGERVVLKIRPANDYQAAPLASLPITLYSQPASYELVVEADRNHSQLMVEADVLEGEAIKTNNRVEFQLNTGGGKLRVLYMEGTTNNEYRWIHNALTEDPDIECTSMVVDQQYVSRPRLQRIGDPYRGFPATKAELFSYDVVICSDISQGAFTREQLDWTVELVEKRGGGFAMVGGHTSFGAGRWDQTSWDRLIPVDMSGGVRGRGFLTQRFKVQVPEEAIDHPIWQLLEDPRQNRLALNKMPQFYGTNLIQRLKPAATVLGQTQTAISGVGVMPVFACESYGRGRTFALSSDSTADWGRDFERYWGESDNRYFRKFWRNVVRWLSESSIAGSKRLAIETDKVIYRLGEEIQVSATAYDNEFNSTVDYQLTARVIPANSTTLDRQPDTIDLQANQQEKQYSGQLTAQLLEAPDSSKSFSTLRAAKLEVVATSGKREVARTMCDIQLLSTTRELSKPAPDWKNMRRLAELTGGDVLESSEDLAQLLEQFPSTPGEMLVQQSPLWHRSMLWAGMLLLLALEWSLRRRAL